MISDTGKLLIVSPYYINKWHATNMQWHGINIPIEEGNNEA